MNHVVLMNSVNYMSVLVYKLILRLRVHLLACSVSTVIYSVLLLQGTRKKKVNLYQNAMRVYTHSSPRSFGVLHCDT